jgi:hypothetical protein
MLHLQSHLQAEHPDNIKLADEVLQSLKYMTRKPPSLTSLCNAQQTLHLVVLLLCIKTPLQHSSWYAALLLVSVP